MDLVVVQVATRTVATVEPLEEAPVAIVPQAMTLMVIPTPMAVQAATLAQAVAQADPLEKIRGQLAGGCHALELKR